MQETDGLHHQKLYNGLPAAKMHSTNGPRSTRRRGSRRKRKLVGSTCASSGNYMGFNDDR